jgi:hypothetical protein
MVGDAGAFALSTGGGAAVAQAFNAIAANAANDQARKPADRFLVVFNLSPFFDSAPIATLSAGARSGYDRT